MFRASLIPLVAMACLVGGCDSKDSALDPRYLISPAICPVCFEKVLFDESSEEKPSRTATRNDREVKTLDPHLVISPPAHPIDIEDVWDRDPSENEIVITGRVGGGKSPIANKVFAFFLTDINVPFCTGQARCSTPWDYCEQRSQQSVRPMLVKIVDDDGSIVRGAARSLLDIKELDVVAVRGVLQTTFAGSTCFVANGIYVYR